jgi:hypothetical protein
MSSDFNHNIIFISKLTVIFSSFKYIPENWQSAEPLQLEEAVYSKVLNRLSVSEFKAPPIVYIVTYSENKITRIIFGIIWNLACIM